MSSDWAQVPSPADPIWNPPVRLQRKCACGGNLGVGGECDACKQKRLAKQSRLPIGASNDPLEREADQVAWQVVTRRSSPAVGGAPVRVRRATTSTGDAKAAAPESVGRVLVGGGKPLEPVVQKDMERRFSHDFSKVRLHSGAMAERSARDVNARAYAIGNNIVFGTAEYAPDTSSGRRLIAHELTHVAQQGAGERVVRAKPKGKAPSAKQKPTIPKICGRPSRRVVGNKISRVSIDVGAHTLSIEWQDQAKAPGGSTGVHSISPGSGLCCVDCNDDKVSQRDGSLCTPKGGEWQVDKTSCALSDHPSARNPTYFQRGGIAIHSGNTSNPPQSHGCTRTSAEISELLHDNIEVGFTKIASSGTWAGTKCYMKASSESLSVRTDVCEGNRLKKKTSPKRVKAKGHDPANAPQEVPATEPPKPPPISSAITEVGLEEGGGTAMDESDWGNTEERVLRDGPGPNNEPESHETIDETLVGDTEVLEGTGGEDESAAG